MNAPDFLTRLRQKNAEKNAPSPNCKNRAKDFTRFVQSPTSAKKSDFSETAPTAKVSPGHTAIEPTVRQPSSPLAAEEEALVLRWLGHIGEGDREVIGGVIRQCQKDADARGYFLRRAREELPKPDPFPDDRRTCDQCANLIARRCQAAKRGEIVAIRNYEPIRDLPRRCEGYMPGPDDPDRRPGRERWPGLIQKGGE